MTQWLWTKTNNVIENLKPLTHYADKPQNKTPNQQDTDLLILKPRQRLSSEHKPKVLRSSFDEAHIVERQPTFTNHLSGHNVEGLIIIILKYTLHTALHNAKHNKIMLNCNNIFFSFTWPPLSETISRKLKIQNNNQ